MLLILGHGLAGALLAHALQARGLQVIVIDRGAPNASTTGSGVINPMAGKRLLRSWGFESFLPAALRTYRNLETELSHPLLRKTGILHFHTTPEEAAVFATRAAEDEDMLTADVAVAPLEPFFRFHHAPGRIAPAYSADVSALLKNLRSRLLQNTVTPSSGGSRGEVALREESFDWNALAVHENGVSYKDLHATHLICCEGWAGANNPYFQNLPFSLAKGEALILSIPGLPRDQIYKHNFTLVPWQASPFSSGAGPSGAFWFGASYDWNFTDPAPTVAFRQKAEALLKGWLKTPYEVVDHRAVVRPATVGQRPFIGMHPLHPRIGIFNGLGSKGVLQAPLLAENLAAHLVESTPLMPEADVARHRRALSRG